MRKSIVLLILLILGSSLSMLSCKKKDDTNLKLPLTINAFNKVESLSPFDSTLVDIFFKKYPELQKYQQETTELYQKRNYQYIWFDTKGILEVSHLLYNKLNNIEDEGIKTTIPYKEKLDVLFQNTTENQSANVNDELLLTSLYFFYTHKVLKGIDDKKTAELGWYLPRKKKSYVNYLDSIIANPSLINKNEKEVLNEYYSLKEV
ncbi:MAG TPA: L,D-transpeptidase, partial [Flavobacterium sp.]|nr:L,D-transpeptidase [Flavobacterium sp.]